MQFRFLRLELKDKTKEEDTSASSFIFFISLKLPPVKGESIDPKEDLTNYARLPMSAHCRFLVAPI